MPRDPETLCIHLQEDESCSIARSAVGIDNTEG